MEGLTVVSTEENLKNADHGTEITVQVFYPQGTGNAEVDRALKSFAEQALASYRQDAAEFLNEQQRGPGLLSRTFTVARPSDGFISVVFFESTDLGGAHPARSFDILTYDLKNGRPLTLDEFLPAGDKDERSRALGFYANYANYVLDRNCLENNNAATCQPNGVTAESVSPSLRNFALTPAGLAVIYGPYEQGSYAEGTKFLNIPKEDLLAWGISDRFWR